MRSTRPSKRPLRRRGTALLSVLWLIAALSMIAFSIADTVRAEIERGIGTQESLRAYFLARGAVEQTLFQIRDAPSVGLTVEQMVDNKRRAHIRYASGEALVEIVSERSKAQMRSVPGPVMRSLLEAFGEREPQISQALAGFSGLGQAAPVQTLGAGLGIGQNFGAGSAFLAARSSMENVEELLLLPGVTPEMVFGRFRRMPDGRMVNAGGFADCLSPFGENSGFDIWNVHPSLLIAYGMDSRTAYSLEQIRQLPLDAAKAGMAAFLAQNSQLLRLSAGPVGPIFQIRATARVRQPNGILSDTRRTVSLLVNFVPPPPQYFWRDGFSYLRWYDQAYSDVGASQAAWLPVEAPPAPVLGSKP